MINMKITKDNIAYYCVAIVISFAILCSTITPSLISSIIGYLLTILVCYSIIKLPLSDGFLILFGCLFMRAVIRFDLGSSHFSFLLLAFPVFIIKYVIEKQYKINLILIIPVIIAIWDIVVGFLNNANALGDQLSWFFALTVLLIAFIERIHLDINAILLIFCFAIWGICLINIIAEIKIFGKSLVPEMYGTWTAIGKEYYMFGKGFPSIAGGNEIVQYVVLFIAALIIHHGSLYRSYKPFLYLSCIVFFYCGIMCISRAFYLELVLFFFLFIITKTNRPYVFISWVLIVCVFCVIFYYRFNDYLKPVLMAVQNRFENGNDSRNSLLDEAIMIINQSLSNTMFGLGSEYTELYGAVHNIIMDSIISLGIIGSILYWWVIIKPAKFYIKKLSDYQIDTCIPLLMFIIYKMVSGCIKDVPFYFIIYFVLNIMKKKNSDNSELSL